MSRARDLTGRRFGRLRVLDRGENAPAAPGEIRRGKTAGAVRWNVACDCGEKALVRAANLVRGNTRSCGCLNRDLIKGIRPSGGPLPGVASRRQSILAEIEDLLVYSTWSQVAEMLGIELESLFRNFQRWEAVGIEIPFDWPRPARRKRNYAPGQRFGRLVLRELGPRRSNGQIRWWADCDCGGERLLTTSSIPKAVGCAKCRKTVKFWRVEGRDL